MVAKLKTVCEISVNNNASRLGREAFGVSGHLRRLPR
jgi:hypothetical protein